MIDDLDKSIRTLLMRDLGISNLKVSFESPDAEFRPRVEPPALDLFLYDLRENRDLRSNEIVTERVQYYNKVLARPAPVRVDCSYLVTAWVGDGSNSRTENEHRLLADAITVLLRYPILPSDVLQGRLKEQEHDPPTATLQPGRLQSIGEFWQALGGVPKAAFDYTVTIGLQPFAQTAEPLAREVDLEVVAASSAIRGAPQFAVQRADLLKGRFTVRYRSR
jgi:hypothetical protein